ncbi:MORN repeat-containing protein 3 [Mus pahari]|uniref:MORN repeat-containing protein 3 n=1 Tax=Mus pahari TaxID=10093 RepID=UPI000A30EE38|nr:MORN repeat-containing protein 3 [Mus pahari]
MPVTKCPRKVEPLWKGWDRKAQKNGLRHQVFAVNGDHYVGEWKGNLKHGKRESLKGLMASVGSEWGYGIQFFGPKEYYEGEWCNDQRSGWGRMYYNNGDIYEGQWQNDKPEGEGMLRLKNRNRYEGSWERGMKNGHGRFFHLDHGQLFEGFWVDNVARCGTMIDFGRDEAPEPTQFPIPKVEILDPDGVLKEALDKLMKPEEGED